MPTMPKLSSISIIDGTIYNNQYNFNYSTWILCKLIGHIYRLYRLPQRRIAYVRILARRNKMRKTLNTHILTTISF